MFSGICWTIITRQFRKNSGQCIHSTGGDTDHDCLIRCRTHELTIVSKLQAAGCWLRNFFYKSFRVLKLRQTERQYRCNQRPLLTQDIKHHYGKGCRGTVVTLALVRPYQNRSWRCDKWLDSSHRRHHQSPGYGEQRGYFSWATRLVLPMEENQFWLCTWYLGNLMEAPYFSNETTTLRHLYSINVQTEQFAMKVTTVLLVDDSATTRSIIRAILE